MNRKAKIALSIAAAAASLLATASACESDADTVSRNVSTEADQFKIARKIVLTNLRSGEVLWEARGLCSIDIARADVLVLICKEPDGSYTKHHLSTGPETSWASTQLSGVDVSKIHTTIVLKPTSVVPNIDITVTEQ
jgi:hypothetical protein